MARILITGTLAIDYVATYVNDFDELPSHRGLNFSIHLDRLHRHFGGCAMNLAYSLKCLGHDPIPFVFTGRDLDDDYQTHLSRMAIDQDGIVRVETAPHSSHAFIFTDIKGNQFTGFYPGPTRTPEFEMHLRRVIHEKHAIDYAIIAPDIPANMIAAAGILKGRGTSFLTDPGQGITDFSATDCQTLVELSNRIIMNQFEYDTLRTYTDVDNIMELVITEGSQGARWMCGDSEGTESAVVPIRPLDPTGCGDAFRAGYVHAQLLGASYQDAVRCGAVVASINIESFGTQEHHLDNLVERFTTAWNERPSWL